MCQSVNWQGLSSKKSRLFLKVALKCRIVLNLHSKGNRKTRNPLKILGFRALILSISKAVYPVFRKDFYDENIVVVLVNDRDMHDRQTHDAQLYL